MTILSSSIKVVRYLEPSLLWLVWKNIFKFSLRRPSGYIRFIDIKLVEEPPFPDKQKLNRYISLAFDIRRTFKIKDTCLTKSLIQCRIWREAGFDCKINFGIRSADDEERFENDNQNMSGHCWISFLGDKIEHNFPLVKQAP